MTTPFDSYPAPGAVGVHGSASAGAPVAPVSQISPDGQWRMENGQWVPNAPVAVAAPPAAQISPDGQWRMENGQWVPNPVITRASTSPAAPAAGGAPPWGSANAGFDQLPPEMRAALEQDAAAPGGSSRFPASDIVWLEPNRPTRVGATADTFIRILPNGQDERLPYWQKQHRHFYNVRTEKGMVKLPRVCPKENAVAPAVPGPCPVCDRRDRADAAGDKDLAKQLNPQLRYFLNVLDGQNMQKHFGTDSTTGQPTCKAMVWGVSKTLFSKITTLVASRGQIFSRTQGTWLKVMCTRNGSEDRDVRYDVIDSGGPGPLPAGFEAIQVHDLSLLNELTPVDQMAREMAESYPDAAGMQFNSGGVPAAAAAPWGSPYQPAAQMPPQGPPAYAPAQMPPQGPPAYAPAPMPPQGPPAYAPAPMPPQGPPGYAPAPMPPQGPPGYAPAPMPPQGPPAYAPPPMPPQGPPAYAPPPMPPQGPPGYPAAPPAASALSAGPKPPF